MWVMRKVGKQWYMEVDLGLIMKFRTQKEAVAYARSMARDVVVVQTNGKERILRHG